MYTKLHFNLPSLSSKIDVDSIFIVLKNYLNKIISCKNIHFKMFNILCPCKLKNKQKTYILTSTTNLKSLSKIITCLQVVSYNVY